MKSCSNRRRAPLGAALVLVLSSGLLVGPARPASATHSTVTSVTGLAHGYRLAVSLFGGVVNTRGFGQVPCGTTNPPGCAPRPDSSSTPSVVLPSAGGSLSASDPDGSFGTVGPAIFFSSGPTTVGSEGSLGTGGQVTTSTTTTSINRTGQEQLTAASATSSCTATSSGVSGSVTITGGTLETDSGWDANEDGDYIDPGEHEPVVVPLDGPIAPNTEVSGHLHVSNPALDPPETWRWVLNEQVLNADGSMTVHVGHQHIEGPTAVGELWVGRADCGVTSAPSPTHGPPVASDDTYGTNEDAPLVVAAPGVLGNDSDPDGDVLSAAVATGASNGAVALNADGSFTYTPIANYSGTDSFTYTVSDGSGTDTGLVTISVAPLNDAPDAVADAYSTNANTALTVSAPGVLGNDVDLDGGSLTATMASGPTKGTAVLQANGSFTYTPNANVIGTDSFTYTASDGQGGSDTATVTLTVRGADLSVGITDSVDPARVGTNVTYTVRVTNHGPAPASGVVLSDTALTNGSLVSVAPSSGTCTVSKAKVITCSLGAMASGASITVQVVAKAPNKAGTMSLRSTSSSAVPDPSSTNNTATQSTAVVR